MLCLLAWAYILAGAGMGMGARDMTRLALFPHQDGHMGMGGFETAWSLSTAAVLVAMWWTMMIAMMAPSAAPAILLYARVHRHALGQGQEGDRLAPTAAFVAGYLLIWLGFSLAAALAHWALERASLIAFMGMGSQSRWLSSGVLIAAGLYQLSPLKQACLAHCRAPAAFLTRHWRPGAGGAVRLGALHGAYCLGCCWLLMALLFIGGVMNLAWIAALAG